MRGWVLVVVSLGILISSGMALGATGYDIQVDGSLDTPTRTVTLAGSDFEVSAVATAQPEGQISVDVSAPHSDRYRVLTYNADSQRVDQVQATGSDTVDFSLPNASYPPGTYSIAIYYDGTHHAIHPLVVEGYAVIIDGPAAANDSSTIDFTVDVTKTNPGKDYTQVEVAIVDDSTTKRYVATEDTPGTYTTAIDLDSFSPGDYRVYAAVRGDKDVFGKKERLGLSDAQSLEITQSGADDDSDSEDQDAPAGGGAGGIGKVETETATDPETEDQTATGTRTVSESDPTETDRSTDVDPSSTDAGSTDQGPRPTEDGSRDSGPATPASDDSVITPGESSPADTTPSTAVGTETPGQPGFGLGVGLVALLLSVLLARRGSN